MPEIRYPIVICWDEEQQAFVADVPDLPTCTGSGATYAEAVLETLEWWKERTHRTKSTRPPPQPGTQNL